MSDFISIIFLFVEIVFLMVVGDNDRMISFM